MPKIVSLSLICFLLLLSNSGCGFDVSAVVDEIDGDIVGDIDGDRSGGGGGTDGGEGEISRPLKPGEPPPAGFCVEAKWIAIEDGDTSCSRPVQIIQSSTFQNDHLQVNLLEVANGVYPIISDLHYKRANRLQWSEDDAERAFPCECVDSFCACALPDNEARYSLTPVNENGASNIELSVAKFRMENPVCGRFVVYERRLFAVACNAVPIPIDPIFDPLKFPNLFEIYFGN